MPPMPAGSYRNMTDDELKALFAYLKTIKPVHNIVPEYQPLPRLQITFTAKCKQRRFSYTLNTWPVFVLIVYSYLCTLFTQFY
jgi:hypothetical protein